MGIGKFFMDSLFLLRYLCRVILMHQGWPAKTGEIGKKAGMMKTTPSAYAWREDPKVTKPRK
jgi:hypothetical protein